MKRTILFAAATTLIAGFCLFGFVNQAGADIQAPEIQEKPAETLTMRITAYASVPDETSDHPFITASGEHVRDGIVASNLLPFGTKIKIPALFGDKIFTVEDRMNRHFQRTIDIWMPDVPAAVDFGVVHTSVVVLGDATSSAISEATAKGAVTL
jgi:3D (Asp-Asp-Asp) domain-containing protein